MVMERDVIFVNNIVEESYYRSGSHGLVFNSIALGVMGELDNLQKNGFSVEGVCDTISTLMDKSFDVRQWLNQRRPKLLVLVGMWNFYDCYNKIQTIKELKNIYPSTPIAVGGIFASCFWEELAKIPQIDFLIRGEAEDPLLQLARHLRNGTPDLATIPNLVFKNAGHVVANEFNYGISEDEFNALNYLDFDSIRDYFAYCKHQVSRNLFFWLHTAKGCPKVCRRCYAYQRDAIQRFYTRAPNRVIRRSIERIRKDIEWLLAKDVKRIGFAMSAPLFPPDYREAFLSQLKFPEVVAMFMAGYREHLEYLPQLVGNFHPRSVSVLEICGASDELSRQYGLGISMEELSATIDATPGIRLLVFELYSKYIGDDDVDDMIGLMIRYRNDNYVVFETNATSTRPYAHLRFDQFIDLSKDLDNWDRVFDADQRRVIARFRNEVQR
ncbi:MAG: hypothetical protein JSV83_10995, partial [Desulfobacterales bacterium]